MPASAHAAAWICSYDYKNEPLIMRFEIQGNKLIREGSSYHVVLDDDLGIIATSVASGPSDAGAVLIAQTILIAKDTGEFNLVTSAVQYTVEQAHGRCVLN